MIMYLQDDINYKLVSDVKQMHLDDSKDAPNVATSLLEGTDVHTNVSE